MFSLSSNWANIASSITPLFIVPIPESERSCICVLGYGFCLCLRLFYWIFEELFRQCGIFCFSFYRCYWCKSYNCIVNDENNPHLTLRAIVVLSTITYTISTAHHKRYEFKSRSLRGVLDAKLCDEICQWLAAGWLFSPTIKLTVTI